MFIYVFFVLSRMCDVPTRDVVCLLVSHFFVLFFMFSKIVFCILGSFVTVDFG